MREGGSQSVPVLGRRPAALAEVPTLLVMMADFNRLEQIAWHEAEVEAALRTLLSQPEVGAVCLLETAGEDAGYFVVTWSYDLEWHGRDAFLTELYLRSELRGRGLAAAALAHVEACAVEGGARALHLAVRPENVVATRAYLHAGFERVERVMMSKELRTALRSTLQEP